MRRLRVNSSMGDVAIDNLGNARPQVIEGNHSMGNLTADLGGAWQPGSVSRVSIDQSMGELTLRVPTSVRLETEFTGDGDARAAAPDPSETAGATAPVLRVRVSSSMGDRRVIRY
jgi:hypothetical protein